MDELNLDEAGEVDLNENDSSIITQCKDIDHHIKL
jgi:hypothetical protein